MLVLPEPVMPWSNLVAEGIFASLAMAVRWAGLRGTGLLVFLRDAFATPVVTGSRRFVSAVPPTNPPEPLATPSPLIRRCLVMPVGRKRLAQSGRGAR